MLSLSRRHCRGFESSVGQFKKLVFVGADENSLLFFIKINKVLVTKAKNCYMSLPFYKFCILKSRALPN